MSEITYPVDSLVVYKKRPARLVKSGERLEIEIEGGNIVKVRPKDIEPLHPGPLRSLKEVTGSQPASGRCGAGLADPGRELAPHCRWPSWPS